MGVGGFWDRGGRSWERGKGAVCIAEDVVTSFAFLYLSWAWLARVD